MANAVSVTLRPIYVEDLAATTVPTGDTVSENVLDQGPTTLNKIPITLLTQLTQAANDAAAASAGVPVGKAYYDSTLRVLAVRMT